MSNEARLDIHATGFWTAAQDAYFDVRVFHPNAPSNSSGSISTAYKKHEDIKKRAYGQRVREVEHDVFTPLVFSTTGGMGQEATTFYKRLADMTAQKPYSIVINWLRCKLSFAAIHASIMHIRGTKSSNNRPLRDGDSITLLLLLRVASHSINVFLFLNFLFIFLFISILFIYCVI